MNVLVENQHLQDIADAIRAKNGTQNTYKPSQMADAIEAIGEGGITPSGVIRITSNDTFDVTPYASAEVDVPTEGIVPTGTIEIDENGTRIDVSQYAYADVGVYPSGEVEITENGSWDVSEFDTAVVDVPNSYTASDEGKVVSDGALVTQTSDTVTANDTYDTTLINSLTVNVSGGGGTTLIEKSVSANGTYKASDDSADGYSKVVVSVPASAVDTGTKNITANGTNQDVVGYAKVDVAVPNSYTASDEGKVVSNGALVSQGSNTVTQNGTVDTTLINSLTVNVSGGGSTETPYVLGGYFKASAYRAYITRNHVKIEAISALSSLSIGLRWIGTLNVDTTWFTINSGSIVKLEYKNVVNASSASWNANFKRVSSTTSLSYGMSANGTHLNGETVTKTATSTDDVGCLFIYIESLSAGGILEFDVELTIDGTRYF